MSTVNEASDMIDKNSRCSPHHWRVPAIEDDALECETCGRHLRFMEDMTPTMRESIVAGYERRCGPEPGEAFRVALNDAFKAARGRMHVRLSNTACMLDGKTARS